MTPDAVCLEKKLFIPKAKVEEVASACHKVLKDMGLKIKGEEKTQEGNITVMAGERALVPLTLRTMLYPFSLQNFFKVAQRSGVHVVVSPSEDGVTLYSCGLALDELTGKPNKYTSDEDIEEITDTMKAMDFENKFLMKIRKLFPTTREIE
jgi:hypothetical protein